MERNTSAITEARSVTMSLGYFRVTLQWGRAAPEPRYKLSALLDFPLAEPFEYRSACSAAEAIDLLEVIGASNEFLDMVLVGDRPKAEVLPFPLKGKT